MTIFPLEGFKAKRALLQEILADAGLSQFQKNVATQLLVINLNSETGQCNPGYETLADAVAGTVRGVMKAVQVLEEQGWLTVERTAGGVAKGKGPRVGNRNKFSFNFDRKTTRTVNGDSQYQNKTKTVNRRSLYKPNSTSETVNRHALQTVNGGSPEERREPEAFSLQGEKASGSPNRRASKPHKPPQPKLPAGPPQLQLPRMAVGMAVNNEATQAASATEAGKGGRILCGRPQPPPPALPPSRPRGWPAELGDHEKVFRAFMALRMFRSPWPDWRYGPAPGSPGCKIPPKVLKGWDARLISEVDKQPVAISA